MEWKREQSLWKCSRPRFPGEAEVERQSPSVERGWGHAGTRAVGRAGTGRTPRRAGGPAAGASAILLYITSSQET